METYKFIGDENEMEWFFNNALKDLSGDPNHSYLACIATRAKKLTDDERKTYAVSGSDGVMLREEIIAPRGKDKVWSFPFFKEHFARYECNKEGMITRTGLPYPEKCLSVMIYAEPSDERKVANYIQTYYNTVTKELIEASMKGSKEGIKAQLGKLGAITKKSKSCHAECTEHVYVHFDFDIRKDLVGNKEAEDEALDVLRSTANEMFGNGSTVIIRTAGGFHLLIARSSISSGAMYLKNMAEDLKKEHFGNVKFSDPLKAFEMMVEERYSYTFEGEEKRKVQAFVPVPGTIMYGSFIPYVANKEDFER